jgi:two-component system, OmpR family, response regulator MtrA
MPRLEGLQLLWAIRSDPLLADLPVIMLTGETNEEVLSNCFRSGATDY